MNRGSNWDDIMRMMEVCWASLTSWFVLRRPPAHNIDELSSVRCEYVVPKMDMLQPFVPKTEVTLPNITEDGVKQLYSEKTQKESLPIYNLYYSPEVKDGEYDAQKKAAEIKAKEEAEKAEKAERNGSQLRTPLFSPTEYQTHLQIDDGNRVKQLQKINDQYFRPPTAAPPFQVAPENRFILNENEDKREQMLWEAINRFKEQNPNISIPSQPKPAPAAPAPAPVRVEPPRLPINPLICSAHKHLGGNVQKMYKRAIAPRPNGVPNIQYPVIQRYRPPCTKSVYILPVKQVIVNAPAAPAAAPAATPTTMPSVADSSSTPFPAPEPQPQTELPAEIPVGERDYSPDEWLNVKA